MQRSDRKGNGPVQADGEARVPFVSIVVPTRNRAALVGECVRSLLVQNYPAKRYEVIVVDDGSEDETPLVGAGLAGRGAEPLVQYFRLRKSGPSAARNKGVLQAAGEIIGFFDDDELAPPDLLGAAVRLLAENSHAGAIGGWCKVWNADRVRWILCDRCAASFKGNAYPFGERAWGEVPFLGAGCLFCRREVFSAVGLFDERWPIYGEDVEWCVRVRRLAGPTLMCRDLWFWHRVTRDDFRLGTLWLRCVAAAGRVAKARKLWGWEGRPAQDVRQGLRFLAHGFRRGCPLGLFQALGRFALAWWWRQERRHPPTTERAFLRQANRTSRE